MTVALYAVIFCWLATMVFLFIHDRAHWNRVKVLMDKSKAERDSLLDRLMARDFSEFKQADALEKQIIQPNKAAGSEEGEYDLSDVGV